MTAPDGPVAVRGASTTPVPPAAGAPADRGRARRERRDIALLAAGMLVSVGGDSAALIALLLELRPVGPGWVAAVLAAELVPFVVFAAPSGRLVDRVDNRRLLVAALLGQAAAAVPLAFVRTPLLVVLLVFVLATVSTVVRPAVNAMVPALTGDERAPSGYAWVSTGSGIGWIVGPAAGGVLTASFGVPAALLADAATFLVLAGACAGLSSSRGHPTGDDDATAPRLGGVAILWRDRLLRSSVLVTAVAVACAVVDNVAAPYRFVDQLRAGSSGYGFYLAVWGVGALAGSQLPRRLPRTAMAAGLALGNTLTGVGILGIGVAPALPVALAASAFGGVGNGIASVAATALVSARVAAHERGRAFASFSAFIQAGTGIGTAGAAPLVVALGAGHAMTLAGATTGAIAGVTTVWAAARRRRM